ncbi:condensation domain-containing protein [Amycolatopsis sp. WQ 127309]|uniref:condensation domain-containing protein n=1 Tax=Amycolatopsis sp. WQ 127309 TaxID=2932773 RepID=UPI001FF57D1A|nr:condensation domain-containing protein [Amycolatopsis sp. WQ 127309]UOZ05528.1 condensation domain-containing protein [Amycolatopsis sp. WQ 127309]
MTSTAVAVIGVAFDLPGCAGWDTLTEVLAAGRDAMRPLPARRAERTGVVTSEADREGGWVDDVTEFDHRYFGLSRAEAELIDPRQRRMLQLAVAAVGDAGYAPGELAGTNAAVLVGGYGGPHPSLSDLLPPEARATGPAATGSLHAYAAGRIAYHLDLRGPAQVLDTSCSSFLVALHEARWKLVRGESDLALVGGYELVLGELPRRAAGADGLGVLSASDRCRPFDHTADGTAYGEGGGFVVLKRLDAALADGDTVHAVLRGSAVNQDARRSTGLTVPSPAAQAEVVTAALRDAARTPAEIGYVEAHGTGTKIGDPIEIEGLAAAFAPYGRGTPVVSSVKGSFGHLGCMAGFAGLVRILAQFRVGEIFPTAHFEAPNPLLPEAPVRIAAHREPWPNADGPRCAGISGFGLSGTNAHVIVEEGPAAASPSIEAGDEQLVVLSARTADGLRQAAGALRDRIAEDVPGFDLAAAAEVLGTGREHFAYRSAWVTSDGKDLVDQLAATWPVHQVENGPGARPVVVALGEPPDVPARRLRAAAAEFAGFAEVVAEAAAAVPEAGWTAAQRGLVWLLGAHRVLTGAGVRPALVLAHGIGAAAARVLRGAQPTADALVAAPATPASPDRMALERALAGFDDPCVLDLAPGSALSEALPGPARATGLLDAVRVLYLAGHDLDWRGLRGRRPRRRLRLPVAPLAEEHCWPALASPGKALSAGEPPPAKQSGEDDVAAVVLGFVREVLKEPELGLDADFFDVGGNSLNGTQLVARINERFGTDVEVLDLFDHGDLASFATAVAEQAALSALEPPAVPVAPTAPAGARSPLSGEQLAIWAGYRLDPEAATYHLPAAFLLADDADLPALSTLLTGLAARHPMVRAYLEDSHDGTPEQVIAPAEPVRPVITELDLTAFPERGPEARQALLRALRGLVAMPLSPYTGPGRYEVVRARFADRTRDVLLLTFHHLFVDGWSWRLLFDDLGGAGTTPARHYFAHVADQRSTLDGPEGADLTRFWQDYLAGSRYVPLPADGAATGTGHDEVVFGLAPDLAAGLRELSRRSRRTPNMVLLAAWAVLLWQLTGDPDVCVAVPAAGRRPEDEPVVGNYATTLVVRVRVRPEEPFSALVDAVRTASLRAVEHQGLPTDRLRRIARPGSADPLAATMFSLSTDVAPLTRLGTDGPGVELLDVGQGGQAFPVGLVLLEYGDELRGRLQYDTGSFEATTAQEWLDAYLGLLGRVVAEDAGFRVGSVAGTAAVRTAPQRPPVPGRPAHVPPRTPMEERLTALWGERFGPGRLGVLDDFLEAGGDSMTAIALASAAAAAGLSLRPKHILDHRTIEAIARVTTELEPERTAERVSEADDTDIGASPAQLEFLAREVPRPDYWNHGVGYALRRSVGTDELDRALRVLAERHPVLRARLRPAGDGWTQTVAPEPPSSTEFDLRDVSPARWAAAVDDLATGLHETLSLAEGPVCRAGVFRRAAGDGPDDLVLAIHHAVVDLYSWNVLTEELAALLDGRPLPPPGPDFPSWTRRLARTIREEPDRLDVGYWLDRSWSAQLRPLPPGGFGVEAATRELDTGYPLAAVTAGATRYEQLLAGLGTALQHWLGVRGGEVAIKLVGHGREDLSGDVDLGRTVGYFNATHPFALSLPGRRTGEAHTAAVAAELRSVPRGGFDFEPALRLHPDPLVRGRLAAIPAPALLFSFWGAPAFLGTGRDDPAGTLGDVRTDLVGRDRSHDLPRTCGLEIYPSVAGDRLHVRWRYSGDLLAEDSVRQLAEHFGAAIERSSPSEENDEGVENP